MAGKYLIIGQTSEKEKPDIVRRGLLHLQELLKRPLTDEEKKRHTKRIVKNIEEGEY